MKNHSIARLAVAATLALISAGSLHADTVTANATVRVFTFSPNDREAGALSLYNDGPGNTQRSWLKFDLSAYNGKTVVGDVTMTLQGGIFGNFLTGVQLGSANAAWDASTITWNNAPGLTIIPDVINPNGTVGPTGPVTWTIPWYIVEKWATAGYNGIGLTSGTGSTQHFYSLADGNAANHPTLTLASGPDGSDGTWTGGSGNWTDAANWATSTVAQGVGKIATINGGTPVGVTMDANRSIGALSISGANHSILAGDGKLALASTTGVPAITVATGVETNIDATVVGIDGLEKLGLGTLELSGANTYSGVTTITSGTILATSNTALGLGGHLGSTMSFIQDGTTLALLGGVSLDEHLHVWGAGVGGLGAIRSISGNNALTNSPSGGPGFALRSNTTVGVEADSLTVSGFYEDGGSFALTKIGPGILQMNAVGTYTGGTIVNEGDLILPSNGGTGRIRGALTINADGRVESTGDGTGLGYFDQISSVTINGGTLTSTGAMHLWNIPGDITMTGGLLQSNNGNSSATTTAYLEWNRTNVTTLASADSATIGGRIRMRGEGGFTGITFNVADGTAPEDLLVTAAVTEAVGGMGITKSGLGTMTITGGTTYSGPTTVSAGVLSLGDGATSTNLGDSGELSIALDAKVNLDFTGNDVIGILTLDGNDAGTGLFNATSHPAYFTGAGSLFIAGPLDDNNGTWSATGDEYWEIPTNWQSGTVASGVDQTATFDGAAGTTVTLAGDLTIGHLNFSAEDYTIAGASKTLTLDASPNPTIHVADTRTATISSKLASFSEVLKTGGGTLKLFGGAGDNNNPGIYNQDLNGFDIQGGTVELTSQFIRLGNINVGPGATLAAAADWATGSNNPWFSGRSAGPITVQNGGILTAINGAVGNSLINGLTLLGGNVTSPGITNADWGAFILASTLVADDNVTSTISADFAVAGTQTVDVVGTSTLLISGGFHDRYAAAGGITKEGDGTLIYTGEKTYSGPTTINAGILQLGDGTTNSSLTRSTITNNASLVVNPGTNQIFDLQVSGSGSLTKTGAATLTITSAQSYTGDTIVNGGSLELQNNLATAVYATVQNAGFETPDYTASNWGYLNNDGIVAWSFTGGGIGSNGSPWLSAAPEGDQAGFIQINGTISQTITVPADDNYLVTFLSANRPGYGSPNLSVALGASTVGTWTNTELASNGAFLTRTTSPIALTAGTHTLTFTGATPSGDTGIAIDAVSVSNATLTNGSLTFQPQGNGASNKVTGTGSAVLSGQFFLDLSLADIANGNTWTLVNHATLTESYGPGFTVTSNLGAFTNNSGTWSLTDGDNTWTFKQSDGTLSLAVVSGDAFASWMSTNFPSIVFPDNQAGGDPDNDSIDNLLEYVLKDGNPSVSNPGILPTSDVSGGNFLFTFHRRADATGTTQVFQYGTDLGGWTDVPVINGGVVAITPDTPSSGIDEIIITIPMGANTEMFGRLKVTK